MFFRHLPLALAGDGEGIHQMRVAGRRLRVALPLVALGPAGRRVRRARRILKRLVRAAAPARDVDVGLALFDEQVAGLGGDPRETKALRGYLVAARTRSRRRMREMILDEEIPRLRRDLRTLVPTAQESVPVVLARIRQTGDVAGEELLTGIEKLADAFDGEALHDLRRRVRRLRYVAETAAELGGDVGKAPKHLKHLQEQLGGIHDTYVLAAWFGRQAAGAEKRQAAERATEARRLEAALLDTARHRHLDYLEQDPVDTVKRALGLLAAAASPSWQDTA